MTGEEIKEVLRTRCRIRHRDIERGTVLVYDYAAACRLTVDASGRLSTSLELITTSGAVPCVVVAAAEECEPVR